MKCTEGIPDREYRIYGAVDIALFHFAVHAQIASVHIGEQIGRYGRMVQCCIEFHKIVPVRAEWHIDFRQIGVPLLAGGTACFVKGEIRHLLLHIFLRAFIIHGRHTDLYKYLVAIFRRSKVKKCLATGVRSSFGIDNGISHNRVCERLGEFGIKKDLLVKGPVLGHFPSAYLGIAQHLESHIQIILTLYGIVHVYNHSRTFASGISIAVESHTVCGCKFGLYVIAVKYDAVITRLGDLVGMYEARGIWEALKSIYLIVDHMGAHSRHKQYVAVIGATGAVEMGMRKTVDKGIGIIIS